MEKKYNNVMDYMEEAKMIIKDRILSNQEILKLISVQTPNPLDAPDIVDLSTIIDKYIFFKDKTLTTTLDQKSIMTMKMYCVKNYGQEDFLSLNIDFCIATHIDIVDLYDSKTRHFQIASRIIDLFDGTGGNWIGSMNLVNTYEPNETPRDYCAINFVLQADVYKTNKPRDNWKNG